MSDEMDIYPYDDMKFAEGRISFDGKVREDTRSSIGLSLDESLVKQATIRLPETTGDAESLQSSLLLMARRHFGQQAGCYVRDEGSRIHIKYPKAGTVSVPLDVFCENLENFITEVLRKEIV
jgi:hypothetical protein